MNSRNYLKAGEAARVWIDIAEAGTTVRAVRKVAYPSFLGLFLVSREEANSGSGYVVAVGLR